MKRFLLGLFLLVGIMGYSQDPDSNMNKMGKPKLLRDSTTVKKLEDIKDSMATVVPVMEEHVISEDATRNIESIMSYQKEQRAKQKKAAIIRIVIGLAFLGVLIVGLSRRRKK
ncbi:MAG: hypothetical protein ABI688_05150 [Bacteroidota bacterium]